MKEHIDHKKDEINKKIEHTKGKIGKRMDKFKDKLHDKEISRAVESLKAAIHKGFEPIKHSFGKKIKIIIEHLDKDIDRKYFSKELKKDKHSLLAKLTHLEKHLAEEMNPEALGITKHKRKWKKIVRKAEKKIRSLKKKIKRFFRHIKEFIYWEFCEGNDLDRYVEHRRRHMADHLKHMKARIKRKIKHFKKKHGHEAAHEVVKAGEKIRTGLRSLENSLNEKIATLKENMHKKHMPKKKVFLNHEMDRIKDSLVKQTDIMKDQWTNAHEHFHGKTKKEV